MFFRSIFVPRNRSFKSLLYILQKYDIIINRQWHNWNIKFSGSNYKTYICCVITFSINTQFLDHFKSTSTLQFVKGKSRDLQIFPRYLSEIVNSVFKESIGDCSGRGGWDLSGLTGGCAGNAGLLLFFLLFLSYI